MRVAHFDCFSGISGDMTLGALVDAGVPGEAIREGVGSLGLPNPADLRRPTNWDGVSEAPAEPSWRDFPGLAERWFRHRDTKEPIGIR